MESSIKKLSQLSPLSSLFLPHSEKMWNLSVFPPLSWESGLGTWGGRGSTALSVRPEGQAGRAWLGHLGVGWVLWGWRPCSTSPLPRRHGIAGSWDRILGPGGSRKLNTVFLWMRSKGETTWSLQILKCFIHSLEVKYVVSSMVSFYNFTLLLTSINYKTCNSRSSYSVPIMVHLCLYLTITWIPLQLGKSLPLLDSRLTWISFWRWD